jgi:hypothetical protein
MLYFSGLSPLLIGPKVFFFQINVTQKAATNVCTCWTQPNQNWPAIIKCHLKGYSWAQQNLLGLYEQTPAYRNSFGLNPVKNGPNLFYDPYGLSQLVSPIRLCLVWQSCRNEVMTLCIDDFARVIKLMAQRNKVSSWFVMLD